MKRRDERVVGHVLEAIDVSTRKAGVKTTLRLCLVFIGLAIMNGCAGSRVVSYVHPNADFLLVRRVALLPFEDLSDNANAGKKVREIFLAELLKPGYFDVVETGEMNKVLAEMDIVDPHNIDAETLKEFASRLGVQAVIYGVIEEYRQSVSTSSGTFPEVSLSIRMVDAESNIVMWMTGASRGGNASVSFMGFGETHFISELTQRLARDIVASLGRRIVVE